MTVKVTVKLDQRAINRELRQRNGTCGRVLAGFAGLTTFEIRKSFLEGAGGVYWRVGSRVIETSRGLQMITTVQHSRPHKIRAVNASRLNFFWQKKGVQVITKEVNHPGSTPPAKLVLSGVERAGRQMTFRRWTTVTGGSSG